MKVYVVTETSYYGYEDGHNTTVDRVFSSEEKAKTYLKDKGSSRWSDYDLGVFEVE